MSLPHRFILVSTGLVVALFAALALWFPATDGDARILATERLARKTAYLSGAALPGASANSDLLETRLSRGGFKLGAPIFVRIHKREFELEVWLQRDGLDGLKFVRFATYPICYFSGQFGPKLRTGDRQSPEGIYQVTARQLNPASRWHRAFNLGFPNTYDKAHGRTGSFLMVHGGCSSVGCYAITNPAVDDLYRLAAAALAAGQHSFQVQALPFRMTPDALASRAGNPQLDFWTELKAVAETFDQTHRPPEVAVCDRHYRLAQPERASTRGTSLPANCHKLLGH